MSDTPTAEELIRALTGLLDAHKEYDIHLNAACHFGDRSWDYGGHYADDVTKAHERLATTLNAYIDSRVMAVLDGMDIITRDMPVRNTLTLG